MDDILIDFLVEYGLKRKHVNTLMRNGIKTIGDLKRYIERSSDPFTALLKVPGIGGAGAYRILKSLEAVTTGEKCESSMKEVKV